MTATEQGFVADFGSVEALLPGADLPAVAAMRRQALQRFAERGLPTTRDEDWKYTSVARITRKAFQSSAAIGPESGLETDALIARHGLPGAHTIVFVNGRLDRQRSALAALPRGVRVHDLGHALGSLLHELPHVEGGFDALNRAFLSHGAEVDIEADCVVDEPLHLIFLSVPAEQPMALHGAVLVSAHERSRCRIVETFGGAGSVDTMTTALTRIRASRGAHVEHCRIEAETGSAFHYGRTIIEQRADSEVIDHSFALGAVLTRHDIDVDLLEARARVDLNGLYLVTGRRHVDHHTSVRHRAPQAVSSEAYVGVLADHGRGVFNGKVVVDAGAFGTVASQSNHNLLLSSNAEIDTKPELQILADDVRCTHGATVGQLDCDALFYLRSRGLDDDVARGMLTYAYAARAVARVGMEAVRRQLESELVDRLRAPGDIAAGNLAS